MGLWIAGEHSSVQEIPTRISSEELVYKHT